MIGYATLADVKLELNATNTTDDAYVKRGIRQVSQRLDREFATWKAPFFAPYIETRQIALVGTSINSATGTLDLRGVNEGISPILSFTSASVNNQSLTLGTNVQVYPSNAIPSFQLQLIGDMYRRGWYNIGCIGCSQGPQHASVAGVWGFNADYANAWMSVDAIATVGGINASATSFTVADVDGANAYGDTPRLSYGALINLDDEWMDVVNTDTATNTVTVIRGVNGSTAASHAQGATVSVYQVDEAVKRIVVRQVSMQYARKGSFDSARHDGFQTIVFPKDLLDEVYGLMDLYANI